MTPAQLTKLAIAALEDMKGINIEVIDVAPLTSIADHMVICTGTSNRHVKALADEVMRKASEAGVGWPRSQGLEQGEWALVDLNGTMIHIMQASARASYQLEKLWDLGQPKPRLDEAQKAKKLAKKLAKKTRKSSAPKKAAVKKTKPGAKKPAAKKSASGKRPAAKPAARKPAGNKAPARKPVVAERPAAKPVKKAVAKKPVAKKKPVVATRKR